MERRAVVKLLGGIGGLGVSAVGAKALTATSAIEGRVEAKSITGRGGDESHTVLAHEGTLNIDDAEYRDDFSDWRNVTVDDALARQFGTDYEEVYYNLHIDHETANRKQNVATGESLAYRIDRTLFNSVQIDDVVHFKTTGTDVPRIDSLE